MNKTNDNWATPKEFYDKLNVEFNFNFDPCPLNYGTITSANDGLLIPWSTRNFINPPYSRKLKELFVKRAIKEFKNGNLCVLLLPVSTSTILFHEYILPNATDIRFIKGRISFIGYNDKGKLVDKGKGMFDSMVVVLDPNI